MPTLVDSLMVEISLDPSKFTPKAQEIVKSLDNLEDAAHRKSLGVEKSAQTMGAAFKGVKGQVIELFAAFTGIKGVKDFVVGTIAAGASVGRLSRAIGVSASEISRWQGAAREFGSTGEAMANSFQSLSNVFTAWQVGGPEAPAVMQIFRVINTAAAQLDSANAKTIDGTKGVNAALKSTADNLKIIHDLSPDKNMASYLAKSIPGMDAGLFDLLIRGGDQVENILKNVKGYTDEEAEAAGRVQRRWDGAKVAVENYGKTKLFATADAASPLAHELFDKPILESKPWDAIFGWGEYANAAARPTFTQPSVNSTSVAGGFTSSGQKEAFIRAESIKRGLDPDVMMKVAKSEGFDKFLGDNGTSGSAFQLHVTPGGRGGAVGDQFAKATGKSPLVPANEALAIQFALDDIRAHGLTAYHGAARVGLGAHAGGAGGGGSQVSMEINGPITVIANNPTEFSTKMRDVSLKRQSEANQSFVGGE